MQNYIINNNNIRTVTLYDKVFLMLIQEVYQKRISPRKGYGCPRRILDEKLGNPDPHSCSAHAVMLIKKLGVFGAIKPMQERFKECKAASMQLHQMHIPNLGEAIDAINNTIPHIRQGCSDYNGGNNIDNACLTAFPSQCGEGGQKVCAGCTILVGAIALGLGIPSAFLALCGGKSD